MKKSLKRTLSLMLVAVMMIACGTCAFADDAVTLQWASTLADSHASSIHLMKAFENIKERTNGNVTIDYFPSSMLGGEGEYFDLVRMGAVFGGTVGQQTYESYTPGVSGYALPFTFANVQDAVRFHFDYALENVWQKEVKDATGMMVLGGYIPGSRQLTTKGVEVHSPEDLKGVKIRSMEAATSIANVKALGGTPIPIAMSELYLALQTGTASGQENAVVTVDSNSLYEVQDYVVLTSHVTQFTTFVVNAALLAGLPAEYQEIIVEEIFNAGKNATEQCINDEAAVLEKFRSEGINVIEASELDMEAFKANAAKVLEEELGADKNYQAWIDYRQAAMDWVAANPAA